MQQPVTVALLSTKLILIQWPKISTRARVTISGPLHRLKMGNGMKASALVRKTCINNGMRYLFYIQSSTTDWDFQSSTDRSSIVYVYQATGVESVGLWKGGEEMKRICLLTRLLILAWLWSPTDCPHRRCGKGQPRTLEGLTAHTYQTWTIVRLPTDSMPPERVPNILLRLRW